MKKWLIGLLLGGFLGILDGLTAPLSAPETLPDLLGIVIGSTFKGLVAGILIGFFAQRVRSVGWGIVFGMIVSGFFAFLVALMQYNESGKNYFWQIMLPGTIVGLVVGYATQRHGVAGKLST